MAQLVGLPERSLRLVKQATSEVAKQDVVRSVLWAMAIGASSLAVGLLAGFLFAPRSGRETRDMISRSIGSAGDEIQQAASDAAQEMARLGCKAQDTVQELAAKLTRSA